MFLDYQLIRFNISHISNLPSHTCILNLYTRFDQHLGNNQVIIVESSTRTAGVK